MNKKFASLTLATALGGAGVAAATVPSIADTASSLATTTASEPNDPTGGPPTD